MRTLRLGSSTVEMHDSGLTVTVLHDGHRIDALPQDDEAYRKRARDLGYGDAIFVMSREHEIAHGILAHVLGLGESPTLRGVAQSNYWREWPAEEAACLALQRYARAAGVNLVEVAERLARP